MGHIMTSQKVRLRLETTFSNISPNKRLNMTSWLALWSLSDNLYDSVGFLEVNEKHSMKQESSKFSGIITLTTLYERKTITPVNTLRGRRWDQLRATGMQKGLKEWILLGVGRLRITWSKQVPVYPGFPRCAGEY